MSNTVDNTTSSSHESTTPVKAKDPSITSLMKKNNFEFTFSERTGSLKIVNLFASKEAKDKSLYFFKMHRLIELQEAINEFVGKYKEDQNVNLPHTPMNKPQGNTDKPRKAKKDNQPKTEKSE